MGSGVRVLAMAGALAYDGPFWASSSRAVPAALAGGAMGLINALGDAITGGRSFTAGQRYEGFVPGFAVAFVAVDPGHVSEARFSYEHAAIPCEVVHDRPLTADEIRTTLVQNRQDACGVGGGPQASPEVTPGQVRQIRHYSY